MSVSIMTEPQNDTSGMSVASRIRLLQSNFGKEPEAPLRKARNSPQTSPKQSHVKKNSEERSPLVSKKLEETAKNTDVTERLSPTTESRNQKLDQSATKVRNSPLPSPRPSPRPSPKSSVKMKHISNSGNSSPIMSRESSLEDPNVRKTSNTKPPLPSKPPLTKLKESKNKDVNDNCVSKSFAKSTDPLKKPVAPKKSWEKADEKKDTPTQRDSSWKLSSGPPSKPVPPSPRSSISEEHCLDHKVIKSAQIDGDTQIVIQANDNFYEDVILSLSQDNPSSDDDSDGNYDMPDPCNTPTDKLDGPEKPKRKGKVLARLSTSRRPPPLPLVPPNDSRPRSSSKPPPLPVSKRPVQTAEEQALYSYATEVRFEVSPRPAIRATHDSCYETPDASAVRGLMLGLNNAKGNYETPDASSVNEFMSNIGDDDVDGDNDYEMPDRESVKKFTESLDQRNAQQDQDESDPDSDAYCDPDSISSLTKRFSPPKVPQAPQKSLPLPPTDDSGNSSSEDSSHDYEDPSEDIPLPRHFSIRRGSMPVFNPDAYLELEREDINTMYQDPAEAFSAKPGHRQQDDFDEYEDLIDEPLYQVYTADVLSHMKRISQKDHKEEEEDVFSEYSTSSIESGQRVLWCQLASVTNSGILANMEPQERKRQEAMFEVITSEASYLKSLSILINIFMSQFIINPSTPAEEQLLDKQQFHFLFGGLSTIKSTSEKFLHSLRGRQEENLIISSISDIVHDHAVNNFECYVKYCSNQVYQERTLRTLINENTAFCEALGKLESSPKSQGLSMQSFLMLPMQRITRLPLLLDAICHHCEPGSDEFCSTNAALNAVQKVVKECNEGARKMERIEEMYFIQQMLSFKIKPIPIVSSSRWLLRRGELACLESEKKLKSPFRTLLRGGKYYRIYLFLFNDLLLVTKIKSEDNFKVVDYCSRSMLRIDNVRTPTGDTLKPTTQEVPTSKHMFTLILLENHREKTTRYICLAETETEKIRWMEAAQPKQKSENDGEKIYEEWDCPQVRAIHSYQSEQPDELSMQEGDVIKVLRKLPDGWYEGVRLTDEEQGWFPANHTEEIHSEHTRARNLMQRYRLLNNATLALSKGILHE